MPIPRKGPRRRNAHAVRSLRSTGWAKSPFEVQANGSVSERDFAHATSSCFGGNIMTNHHNISRRQMLAMSVAAGGLAFSGIGGASAQQSAKRIEQLDPVL